MFVKNVPFSQDLKPLFCFLGVTHNKKRKKKKKGSVVKSDLLESPDGFRNRFDVSYWSFQVWLAIKCIVEGGIAPQAGIVVAPEELRLRAKGAIFFFFSSSARPRASLRVGRATTVSAAISDFSPWSDNDIQSPFLLRACIL